MVVPLLTLAIPVRDPGGFNFEYAQDRIAVHWVTVAAVVLLVLALARVLSTATGRRAAARTISTLIDQVAGEPRQLAELAQRVADARPAAHGETLVLGQRARPAGVAPAGARTRTRPAARA